MDLIKTIKEIPEKFIEIIDFFKQYISDLFLISFKSQKFIQRFNWSITERKLYTKSFLFLFTSVLLFEVTIKIIDRYSDAKTSINDVGISTAIQSGNLWNISWESILYRTIPIVFLIFGIAWLLSIVSSKDKNLQAKLLVLFPYALWKSIILLIYFSILTIVFLAILVLIIYIFYHDVALWILITYQYVIVLIGLTSILLTLKKSKIFISKLLPESYSIKSKFGYFFFRLGMVLSLIVPIWWSTVSLSSPASKIAIQPEQILLDTSDVVTVSVSLRNLSDETLFTTNKGNVISWWDDEKPVYRNDIFSHDRVANGSFYINTVEDKELTDGYLKFIYNGNKANASLVPDSYSPYDFMGGPEYVPPAQEEYESTSLSFNEILSDRKKGRIDVTIAVSTKGGIISQKTVMIHASK